MSSRYTSTTGTACSYLSQHPRYSSEAKCILPPSPASQTSISHYPAVQLAADAINTVLLHVSSDVRTHVTTIAMGTAFYERAFERQGDLAFTSKGEEMVLGKLREKLDHGGTVAYPSEHCLLLTVNELLADLLRVGSLNSTQLFYSCADCPCPASLNRYNPYPLQMGTMAWLGLRRKGKDETVDHLKDTLLRDWTYKSEEESNGTA